MASDARYTLAGPDKSGRWFVVDQETGEPVFGPVGQEKAGRKCEEWNGLEARVRSDVVRLACVNACGGSAAVFRPASGQPVPRACDACLDREQAEEQARRLEMERQQREKSIRTLMQAAGMNWLEYGRCTLENFDPNPDAPALRAATRFVAAFIAGKRPSLYLWSKRPGSSTIAAGAGKSHLANAVGRALLLEPLVKPVDVRYVFVPKLLEDYKAAMDEKRTGEVMRMLVEPELLIWDDFGAERWATDFAPGLIFTVLESRRGRSDLFTSNHPIEKVETKSEHGARIASRLSRCYQVCLTGPDRRPQQNRRST